MLPVGFYALTIGAVAYVGGVLEAGAFVVEVRAAAVSAGLSVEVVPAPQPAPPAA